ncbi:two-component system, NtrC family, nitrogen regulation sensor histidine kinase GlnL [Aliiroseovarius halocynthiae]|uniref:histidine kinase n=1 Tax=Aliiroseovarius halocynthiae TaxID=985055 RepID=A0A545SWB7_9RHOB|nr:ATP-binding protein [Aliiroseovarius halocynthiae]TQV69263.1 PAS domain-containing sensor histidine kinase [Aliiroseovarius halocynthiae]SMR72034.1 two-component system, NtrC family, nitrogen regulation sensor histidine kinase GlnL [Aliiroseovarius halocynthiae]
MTHDDRIWSVLPVPAFELDVSGLVRRMNGAAESFLNLSEKRLIGKHPNVALGFSLDFDDLLARVRQSEGALYVDGVNLRLAGGDQREVNLHIAPLPGGEDVSEGYVAVLNPRNGPEALGQVQGAKSAARQAIGMAEMLAHEIKNPLAGIAGAAQLLSMSLPPEDQEMTDLIVAETRRVVALLDQVERFGDLRPPERQPTNIHDLLDRAWATAQLGYASGMGCEKLYDPSLPDVFVDADQIQQIFLNLIKNASEAADNKGNITLKTFYDGGLRVALPGGDQAHLPIQVEVIDDGPGLPPDIAENVFEPFVSGRENGTGLGLALVSKIVTDHGALISVNSVPGRTAFRISLPVAKSQLHPNAKP